MFDQATPRYYASKKGEPFDPSTYNLGSVMMVPSVQDARSSGVLYSRGQLSPLPDEGIIWEPREEETFDFIIWCAGFWFGG